MFLLLAMLVFFTTTDACMRNKAVVKITCPPDIVTTADERSDSTLVSWQRRDFGIQSTHPIKGIYQIVPIYGAPATVSKRFYEGRHYVEYKAVDESGHFATCSFTVTVNVVRCDRLFNPNPHIGHLTCDAANVLGSRCNLTCIEGYYVVGQDRIQCHREGTWSGDIPFCHTTQCGDPGTPLNGVRLCTTVNHAYGSICSFACSNGYQLLGSDKLVCTARGGRTFWSSDAPICEEIQPPTIKECPGDSVIRTSSPVKELERPPISFLTADGQEAPFTCSHFEQNRKHNFTLGVHVVTCTAFDPKFGERSTVTCQFTVIVKANPCRALPQPQNGFLLCYRVHGGGSSPLDTACTLHCNNGYELPRADGPQSAEFLCDHTGHWNPPDVVPSCVRPKRPQELKLPSEILYTSSNCSQAAPLRSVRIQFKSALQSTIRLQEDCSMNQGNCIVDEVTTDCHHQPATDVRLRRNLARHSRLFTSQGGAAGSSSAPRGRRQLRHNARSHSNIDNTNNNNNQNDNVRSHTSILTSSVWKRETTHPDFTSDFVLPIRFHFGTRVPSSGDGEWPEGYHRAQLLLYGMFEYFERQVQAGHFSISEAVRDIWLVERAESLAFAEVQVICDIGYKFKDDIKLCVPCGAGTHYSIEDERCVLCPAGSYQDEEAQFGCKSCPLGSSTAEAGSTNITQCVGMCRYFCG